MLLFWHLKTADCLKRKKEIIIFRNKYICLKSNPTDDFMFAYINTRFLFEFFQFRNIFS